MFKKQKLKRKKSDPDVNYILSKKKIIFTCNNVTEIRLYKYPRENITSHWLIQIALINTNLLVTEYCIDINIPLEFSLLVASDVFTHDTSTPFRFCEE